MRDLHNSIYPKRGLSPKAATTDNTAYVSEIIDTSGFGSVEWLTLIGANTDADVTFTTLVEHDDDSGFATATAVADADLLGTEALAGFQYDDDNELRKIGYIGNRRYVRVTITPANNGAGNVFVAGCWVLGHPRVKPTANPPA